MTEDGNIFIQDETSGIGNGAHAKLEIEYQVSDGFDFVTGTLDVRVDGRNNRGDHVYGTNDSDVMLGTKFAEIFHGRDGGDKIRGDFGNDVLFGDAGNDLLEGDNGDDVLIGGRGNDLMRGNSGRDTYVITKGDGRDRIVVDSSRQDVIDLSDFNFRSFDELNKLVKVKYTDLVIDLPGQDWLFVRNGDWFGVDVII